MSSIETATFAAGCFWGVESEFAQTPGVLNTAVGYCGGQKENPTYKEVCSGTTGHAEVCQVEFDSSRTSFENLLEKFFSLHNPTTINRQGPDVGTQYRSAIFFHNDDQKQAAEKMIATLTEARRFSSPIVTQVVPFEKFWRAEEYHQKYFEKNGGGHCNLY